jgi:low temperature requirement protein LtrA
MVELFFDLVFVFAVTQLSHALLADLNSVGALRIALLLPAVWWVWVYTSWTTNWLNPERIPVRLCLFAMMIAGLVLAAAIPNAFNAGAPFFASTYVAMQIGRTLFVLWAVRNASPTLFRNFQRILVWLALASAVWLVGAFAPEQTRFTWWMLALAIELVAPALYYWVPGLGRSASMEWNIDGAHMAERFALFVIIALGESLLITGATFAGLEWNAAAMLGMLIAMVGTIAMWWVYFDTGAERAQHRIVHASDPGRQARLAYTYLHLPIVAGIIVCAVADELVLVHPDHVSNAGIATILGGPALYLIGNLLFKWVTNERRTPPLSHMIGVGLLAILTPFAWVQWFSALTLATLTTLILVIVAAWESVALRRPARPVESLKQSH